MAELAVGIVDVFADVPLSGNPLAVVEGGETLADADLRLVAREFNQAETTFIQPGTRGDRRLRSFTAAGFEVVGAGHNALGAWLWLALTGQLGSLDRPTTFRQEIGPDVLPITLERIDGRVIGRMRQSPLRVSPHGPDVPALADALGLDVSEVLTKPPPRVADTGGAHLMVRVAGREVVDRAEAAAPTLLRVLSGAGAEGCYVYAHEAGTAAAYARFFNPTVGLWEDAATGTAAGPLAGYLAASGLLPGNRLVVEQGVRMGRRSLLTVQLTPDPELSGSGVIVLRGTIHV